LYSAIASWATRLFLRTTEFLWQEGHTAHATEQEAVEETRRMLEVYRVFAEKHMAIPVLTGVKTESEKFAGAVDTYCIEAMMQDGRALQAGTSHYLGQNFAKAFDVKFQDKSGKLEYVYATSWGVSTRLIGALVMAHSDDNGLVLPPMLAPIPVAIVPIAKSDAERAAVLAAAARVKDQIGDSINVHIDDRENVSVGWKFNDWELRGVPIRLEIGPRDLADNQVTAVRRDTGEKQTVGLDAAADFVRKELDNIQEALCRRALELRNHNTRALDDYDSFKEQMTQPVPGFVNAHWCGNEECEGRVQEETKATIRCIPLNQQAEQGACICCGKESAGRVVFAKAY